MYIQKIQLKSFIVVLISIFFIGNSVAFATDPVTQFAVEKAAQVVATTVAATKEIEKVVTEATEKKEPGSTVAAVKTEPPLKNGPDILNCKATAKILYFVDDVPTSDSLGISCSLSYPASVWVGVYNKTFNPKTEDNSEHEIKALWNPKMMKVGDFYASWNGLDNADQAPALDDYVIVAGAKLDDKYKTDFSVQKFKIVNSVDQKTVNEVTNESPKNADGKVDATNLHGSPEVKKEVVASKCPGANYPHDIAENAVEELIKSAYDKCLVRGYEDGSFRPESGLTRAEATKIVLLAKGKLAHKGCFTNDCGSKFKDLDAWQGPWVRVAWDLKIVSGIDSNKFLPNRALSRAEAAALTVKAFGFSPYQGCFTANCGAGHPDNFFRDIFNNWQGPYLRVLWDKGLINTLEKNKFFPEREITRADFIKTIMTITGK